MQVTCKQGDEPHVRLQLVDKLDTLAERQVTWFLPWEETAEARDTAGTVDWILSMHVCEPLTKFSF